MEIEISSTSMARCYTTVFNNFHVLSHIKKIRVAFRKFFGAEDPRRVADFITAFVNAMNNTSISHVEELVIGYKHPIREENAPINYGLWSIDSSFASKHTRELLTQLTPLKLPLKKFAFYEEPRSPYAKYMTLGDIIGNESVWMPVANFIESIRSTVRSLDFEIAFCYQNVHVTKRLHKVLASLPNLAKIKINAIGNEEKYNTTVIKNLCEAFISQIAEGIHLNQNIHSVTFAYAALHRPSDEAIWSLLCADHIRNYKLKYPPLTAGASQTVTTCLYFHGRKKPIESFKFYEIREKPPVETSWNPFMLTMLRAHVSRMRSGLRALGFKQWDHWRTSAESFSVLLSQSRKTLKYLRIENQMPFQYEEHGSAFLLVLNALRITGVKLETFKYHQVPTSNITAEGFEAFMSSEFALYLKKMSLKKVRIYHLESREISPGPILNRFGQLLPSCERDVMTFVNAMSQAPQLKQWDLCNFYLPFSYYDVLLYGAVSDTVINSWSKKNWESVNGYKSIHHFQNQVDLKRRTDMRNLRDIDAEEESAHFPFFLGVL